MIPRLLHAAGSLLDHLPALGDRALDALASPLAGLAASVLQAWYGGR